MFAGKFAPSYHDAYEVTPSKYLKDGICAMLSAIARVGALSGSATPNKSERFFLATAFACSFSLLKSSLYPPLKIDFLHLISAPVVVRKFPAYAPTATASMSLKIGTLQVSFSIGTSIYLFKPFLRKENRAILLSSFAHSASKVNLIV